jgi:hypothetical protein
VRVKCVKSCKLIMGSGKAILLKGMTFEGDRPALLRGADDSVCALPSSAN